MRRRASRIHQIGGVQIGKRLGVVGFIPPAKMIEIAEERTWGLQHMFLHAGAKAEDVATFARSCYMQGVNDAADALAWTEKKEQKQ